MALILIVDDDESDRLLLRTTLEEIGHDLLLAASGAEAMRLYLRHPVDVVVTDIQMPNGDGIELISSLKGMDAHVAILAVSSDRENRLQTAHHLGALLTLRKPFTKESLFSAVEACLSADPPVQPGG